MDIASKSIVDKGNENVNSFNLKHSTAESGSLIKPTLEKNISDRVKNKIENVAIAVETRVHEALLSAMNKLVVATMELALS